MSVWTLTRIGDATLVASCEQRIDPDVNAQVLVLSDEVRGRGYTGVRDVVESYCSVTVHFDPVTTDVDRIESDLEEMTADEADLAEAVRGAARHEARRISVPVCYGGIHGPDLPVVAEHAGCTEAEAVDLHASETYRVYLLGFLPGFAYMGSVPPALAIARRETPRLEVPAGSVGIAGRQTGVYPVIAPGGWQLIGRTPLRLFDLAAEPPFLFRAGDAVRFEPVTQTVFDRLATAG